MKHLTFASRKHLTCRDIAFITHCLSKSASEAEAICHLLVDPQTVDSILDHPKLIETVLNSVEQLNFSSQLYFYLITRHSLKSSGLDDADLADYVASVLNEQLKQTKAPHASLFYLVDWLSELEKVPREKHFKLYVMAGNYLLFLTGIFPQRLKERCRRQGAPDVDFYEAIARNSFASASRQIQSHANDSENIYQRIADQFPTVRYALNDASERLMHLGD